MQDQQQLWLGSEEDSPTKSLERGARGIPTFLKVKKPKQTKEKQGQGGTKETAGKPLQTELHCRAGPVIKLWPGGI